MAVRRIVLYKENPEALRAKCKPIPAVGRRATRLIRDLKDTLNRTSDGIGLAAPQINVHSRVIVVRLGGDGSDRKPGPPLAIINPHVLEAGDAQRDFDGCLSFPGLYGETVRPHFLRVAGLGENGECLERTFNGFDAVVVHHEIDHLDGILFTDRVEKLEDLYTLVEDGRGEMTRQAVWGPLPYLTSASRNVGLHKARSRAQPSREANVRTKRTPCRSEEAWSKTHDEAKC